MSSVREAYHDNVRYDVFPYLPVSPRQVLDIGGGVGSTARALKRKSAGTRVGLIDLVAPEINDGGIDFAYSASVDDPRTVELVLKEQGTSDVVLCLDVLEHLVNPWGTLENICQLLEPGGYLIASIPNVQHISVVGDLILGHWNLKDEGILDRTHLRFFTKESATALISSSGMKIDLVTSLLPNNSRSGRLNTITFRIFENFLTSQFLIRASRV